MPKKETPIVPAHVNGNVKKAVQAGKYMIVCFRVDEEGVLHMDRVTNEFPLLQLPRAASMLDSDLEAEAEKIRPKPTEAKPSPRPGKTESKRRPPPG